MQPRRLLRNLKARTKRVLGPTGRNIVRRAINPARIALIKSAARKEIARIRNKPIDPKEIIGRSIGELGTHLKIHDIRKELLEIREQLNTHRKIEKLERQKRKVA
ncbi:MAG: hypothetical protein Q7K42_02610 [Candidatus Diapherotrites archaeon]|nr:hypothetical protein [Candidatus Diapherotrites archaeon]